jgi:pimeloyl-ACP methyl ester carboxylesterase
MKEDVLICGNRRALIGIATAPDTSADNADLPAVIMLNAALTHRVGPNRSYVRMARELAQDGFRVLRLDLSGVGDSLPRADNPSLEEGVSTDVAEAMDTLQQQYQVQRFILIGICSGGLVALLVAARDPRVIAAFLVDPEGITDDWTRRDQQRKEANYYSNYYGRAALANRDRLRRFLTGKADYRTIANNVFRFVIWNRISALMFRLRMKFGATQAAATPDNDNGVAENAIRRVFLEAVERADLYLIYADGGTGNDFFSTIVGKDFDRLLQAGKISVATVTQSDHLFTTLASQHKLVAEIRAGISRSVSSGTLSI